MMKLKYIVPATKIHHVTTSFLLRTSTLQLNTSGPHKINNASTQAASRLGSPIWDEEEAEEDEMGY